MIVSRSHPPPEAHRRPDRGLRDDEPVCATLQRDTTQSTPHELVTLDEQVMLINDSMILWRQEISNPRLFSLKPEVARAKKLLKAKKFLTHKFEHPSNSSNSGRKNEETNQTF